MLLWSLRRWCSYDVSAVMTYQNLHSNARLADLEKEFTEVEVESFSFRWIKFRFSLQFFIPIFDRCKMKFHFAKQKRKLSTKLVKFASILNWATELSEIYTDAEREREHR